MVNVGQSWYRMITLTSPAAALRAFVFLGEKAFERAVALQIATLVRRHVVTGMPPMVLPVHDDPIVSRHSGDYLTMTRCDKAALRATASAR